MPVVSGRSWTVLIKDFSRSQMVLWTGLLVVALAAAAKASSVNDCRSVEYVYLSRGLDSKEVPRQPRQGTQLEICPRGLTCCTEEMERKLRYVSKEQYVKDITASAKSMQQFFNNKATKFNDLFPELMSTSKLNFHRLFKKTYGIVYLKNSDVFVNFFKDLEKYYEQGNVDLEAALRKFFTSLYKRMFEVYHAQYKIDSRYLTCVSQTMKSLQPFGDVPSKLSEQLRRSFVATRTFNQALLSGKIILQNIVKIQPKDTCVMALTKMSLCPACEGFTAIKPCNDYCVNVRKGCLAYHAEFGVHWDKFLDNLKDLADRLIGPFDVEDVIDPIGIKISDAIMNFKHSGYDVSQKVFQECGTLRIQKREAPQGRGRRRNRRKNKKKSKVSKLKSQLSEVKERVIAYKGFWTRLPYAMCKEDEPGPNSDKQYSDGGDSKCWNGQQAAQYTSSVVRDGLAYQEYNPEVTVDVGRVDNAVQKQIYALKAINKKLTQAIKGQNVEWSTDDQSHDSPQDYGSGNCGDNNDDEDCYDYNYEGSGSSEEPDHYDQENNEHDKEPDYETNEEENIYNVAPPNDVVYEANSDDVSQDESEEEYADNWPPWVTTSANEDESTINVIDTNDIGRSEQKSKSSSVTLAVVYYVVPLMTCIIGSAFSP